jgi:hypothetical protein
VERDLTLRSLETAAARPAPHPYYGVLRASGGSSRDEWLVSRRYLSQESLSSVLDENDHTLTNKKNNDNKEVPALSAA